MPALVPEPQHQRPGRSLRDRLDEAREKLVAQLRHLAEVDSLGQAVGDRYDERARELDAAGLPEEADQKAGQDLAQEKRGWPEQQRITEIYSEGMALAPLFASVLSEVQDEIIRHVAVRPDAKPKLEAFGQLPLVQNSREVVLSPRRALGNLETVIVIVDSLRAAPVAQRRHSEEKVHGKGEVVN